MWLLVLGDFANGEKVFFLLKIVESAVWALSPGIKIRRTAKTTTAAGFIRSPIDSVTEFILRTGGSPARAAIFCCFESAGRHGQVLPYFTRYLVFSRARRFLI